MQLTPANDGCWLHATHVNVLVGGTRRHSHKNTPNIPSTHACSPACMVVGVLWHAVTTRVCGWRGPRGWTALPQQTAAAKQSPTLLSERSSQSPQIGCPPLQAAGHRNKASGPADRDAGCRESNQHHPPLRMHRVQLPCCSHTPAMRDTYNTPLEAGASQRSVPVIANLPPCTAARNTAHPSARNATTLINGWRAAHITRPPRWRQ